MSRLGENIYGVDAETLENVICRDLNQKGLSLCLVEAGLEPTLAARVRLGQPNQITMEELLEAPQTEAGLQESLSTMLEKISCDIGFGIVLNQNDAVQIIYAYQDPNQQISMQRNYGGPREYAPLWAQNTGLDFLRRQLKQNIGN